MAIVKLGAKAVGSIVKLKENGVPVDYLIVHQGRPSSLYDASCDGTWLLRKDVLEKRYWNITAATNCADSDIIAYLNSAVLGRFDADIQAQIKLVKIPYWPGSGNVASGTNGLSTRIFPLSGVEVGHDSNAKDGAKLSYFRAGTAADSKRVAKLDGVDVFWWLRTPDTNLPSYILVVHTNGQLGSRSKPNESHGIRWALILPSNLVVSDDGSVSTNTAPATPASVSIPGSIHGGTSIEVSWSAAADAENNLEGYAVERSTDGGTTWTQIYQGGGTSTTNTVAFGTESVMYRVRAYDSEGLYSSYRSSAQVTVINNTAPTAPGSITVPDTVFGGGSAEVSWTASTDGENNLAGYALERRVDEGAWTEIFRGDALSFADTVTKGWLSVAWRVRAYDSENAYSGYTASEIRAVDNNTPPAITCDLPSGTSLGVKQEGFDVSYSASDEDGDTVTVTEAVDGSVLRSFAAVDGEENTLHLDGLDFMKLLNGPHALAITASDDKASTVHRLIFTKSVTAASVSLAQPMTADAPISVCVLSVTGSIPLDAQYSVKVTNNGLDDAPVWEECTAAVQTGANHIFVNQTAVNGFAFNFKLEVERGASGLGGYITSVQGGFQ